MSNWNNSQGSPASPTETENFKNSTFRNFENSTFRDSENQEKSNFEVKTLVMTFSEFQAKVLRSDVVLPVTVSSATTDVTVVNLIADVTTEEIINFTLLNVTDPLDTLFGDENSTNEIFADDDVGDFISDSINDDVTVNNTSSSYDVNEASADQPTQDESTPNDPTYNVIISQNFRNLKNIPPHNFFFSQSFENSAKKEFFKIGSLWIK